MTLPDGYRLHSGLPEQSDYRRLRQESGLTPCSVEQSRLALVGSWAGCYVVHTKDDTTVGMGRIIGDGGWYFHIVDMAVLPEHQRQGLGHAILTALMHHISTHAPRNAFVSLMANPPGRSLYSRHGFTERRDKSIGMAQWTA